MARKKTAKTEKENKNMEADNLENELVVEQEQEVVNGANEEKESTAAESEYEEETVIEEVEKQLEALENERNEWKDKYLRLAAEFDNFRKRTLNEKMELTKSAGKDVLVDLLPVVDDFDRALESISGAQDVASLQEGVDLIYTKLVSTLSQKGVKEMQARETDFDTDLHEAVTKIPAPDKKLKGKVVDVIQKGYLLNDKVLRYAKVVVGE